MLDFIGSVKGITKSFDREAFALTIFRTNLGIRVFGALIFQSAISTPLRLIVVISGTIVTSKWLDNAFFPTMKDIGSWFGKYSTGEQFGISMALTVLGWIAAFVIAYWGNRQQQRNGLLIDVATEFKKSSDIFVDKVSNIARTLTFVGELEEILLDPQVDDAVKLARIHQAKAMFANASNAYQYIVENQGIFIRSVSNISAFLPNSFVKKSVGYLIDLIISIHQNTTPTLPPIPDTANPIGDFVRQADFDHFRASGRELDGIDFKYSLSQGIIYGYLHRGLIPSPSWGMLKLLTKKPMAKVLLEIAKQPPLEKKVAEAIAQLDK